MMRGGCFSKWARTSLRPVCCLATWWATLASKATDLVIIRTRAAVRQQVLNERTVLGARIRRPGQSQVEQDRFYGHAAVSPLQRESGGR